MDKLTNSTITISMSYRDVIMLGAMIAIVMASIFAYRKSQAWIPTLAIAFVVLFWATKTEGFSIPSFFLGGPSMNPTMSTVYDAVEPPIVYMTNEMQQDAYSQPPSDIPSEYSTRTNYPAHYDSNGLTSRQAQLQFNDARTRDEIQYRDDMVRIHQNRMNRMYGHGCVDAVSPQINYLP